MKRYQHFCSAISKKYTQVSNTRNLRERIKAKVLFTFSLWDLHPVFTENNNDNCFHAMIILEFLWA